VIRVWFLTAFGGAAGWELDEARPRAPSTETGS
jgi:hypothetical protein